MSNLKVIKEAGDATICYISDEKTALEKLNDAIVRYEQVDDELAGSILTEYAAFVEYGAKDTPSYTFTGSNSEDWFIVQVELKERKPDRDTDAGEVIQS
jgi:hypothetical protein